MSPRVGCGVLILESKATSAAPVVQPVAEMLTRAVRWFLIAAPVVAGVVLLIFGTAGAISEAFGITLIGIAPIVWMWNWFIRMSFDEQSRERESEAREQRVREQRRLRQTPPPRKPAPPHPPHRLGPRRPRRPQ
jgi:hypothetical protein